MEGSFPESNLNSRDGCHVLNSSTCNTDQLYKCTCITLNSNASILLSGFWLANALRWVLMKFLPHFELDSHMENEAEMGQKKSGMEIF